MTNAYLEKSGSLHVSQYPRAKQESPKHAIDSRATESALCQDAILRSFYNFLGKEPCSCLVSAFWGI